MPGDESTGAPAEEPNASKWDSGLIVRLVITVLMLLVVVWWLSIVASKLSSQPTLSTDGKVIFDEFQRAKDILIAVLPLLTLALGYWFGAQGTDKAEKKADAAEKKAGDATEEAKTAGNQVKAFLQVSDEDLITKAQAAAPEAFGRTKNR